MSTSAQQWWLYHTEYYYDAFADEYRNIWRGMDLSDEEIYWRCYYRALVAFLRSDPDAIIDRRRLLYSYLLPEFKVNSSTDTLNRYRKQLPVSSRVRRVVRNICTAYDQEPERTHVDERMRGIYEALDVASQFPKLYHRARLTGMVAVRPLYINGRWVVDYITPEHFTIATDPNDWRTVSAITYTQASEDGGVEYVTWSSDTITVTDANGRQRSTAPNPYGRLPFVFLRLGDEDGIYPSGMLELVEGQLDANKIKWLSSVNLTFTGSPVWVATNFNAKGGLSFSPDKVIAIDGVRVGEGFEAPPELDVVSPESAYQAIDDFGRIREQMLQQDEGIPASMVNDGQGDPPSGVARLIERSELTEIRYADQKSLAKFERDFAEVVGVVASVDAGVVITDTSLEVSFADEGVVMEPEKEYAFDKQKMQDGVMAPEQFYGKWGGLAPDGLGAELARRRALQSALLGGTATEQNGAPAENEENL